MTTPTVAAPTRLLRPRARTRGLTRLEFALAVVVVGALAALLLVRLGELHQASRPARVQAAAAAVRAAASLFHSRCLLERSRIGTDTRADPCDMLELDGTAVRGVHGWPAAQADGIARAAALPLQPGPGRDPFVLTALRHGDTPALRIALPGTHCGFVYAQAASAQAEPEVLPDRCD
ncbi:MAG: hypothetical protein L6Q73_14385 [Aquabacterium sp.]|nr:hypothetical protein [Aquabacterium sp.]